ncbi:pentapeptide repeat-containing protein [Candidatus Peregrinibacteria bacterium]|nr:pentapeptide repeat-containing protein [Candidatus Peregrinibacteria bacterium]
MIYQKEKLIALQGRWNTQKGKKLIKTIKESHCYLSTGAFRQKIKNFPFTNDEEVKGCVDLRGIPLSGFDFRIPVKEDDGFLEDLAILSSIHFEGAFLKHCNFQDGAIHDCFFEQADISHSDFRNTSLANCNFQESECNGINLAGAKLINCSFIDASIRDVIGTSTIVDQKTTFGKELKSEKEGNFHLTSIEYKQIKEMYKNSSLHSVADKYHYREMVAKRKILARNNPVRWLNYFFGDVLCKYGTSFFRVFTFSLIFMAACAVVYLFSGDLLYNNQQLDNLYFLDSMYFSTVTFTTLGYGDYQAIGAIRFLAAAESFAGVALMSLFTVIIARNIIRD